MLSPNLQARCRTPYSALQYILDFLSKQIQKNTAKTVRFHSAAQHLLTSEGQKTAGSRIQASQIAPTLIISQGVER